MDGLIASRDADRTRETMGLDANSGDLDRPTGRFKLSNGSRSPSKSANFIGAVQMGMLALAILSGELFGKSTHTLATADYANGMLLVCGFAMLASYWERNDVIARGTALGALLERAAYVAFLVLAATFVSAQLAEVPWEYLSPTRTFVWVYGIAAAGVVVPAAIDWTAQHRKVRRVAVLGEGDAAVQLAQRLRAGMAGTDVCLIPSRSLALVAERAWNEPSYADPKLVELAPDVAIISAVAGDQESAARLADHLAPLGVDVLLHAPYGTSYSAGPIVSLGGASFIRIFPKPLRAYQAGLKRAFDVVASTMILAFLLPVFVVVAAAIKLDSRGPVLFRQPRVGRGGLHFTVLKFRTMREDAGDVLADKLTVRNDPRLTRIGGFLRKTSIDELPQLLNVLFGSMSLVGPRPHALNAKANGAFYSDVVANYNARHRVKPGVTGLAQVLGWRGPTDTHAQIEQRVANDLRYISDWSFFRDLLILVRTAFALFGKNAL